MKDSDARLREICGYRSREPVAVNPDAQKTIKDCAKFHEAKPCFRQQSGQPLCKGCPKREKQ